MFEKEIRITGKHAQYMIMLTKNIGESNGKLFKSNIDLYIQASLVGFLYKKKAEKDSTTKDTSDKLFSTHILSGELNSAKDSLIFNMQLILLLDKEYEPDERKRTDKAFREIESNDNDLELYESYALGGIEVLYEKLIKYSSSPDDFIEKITSFTNDIHNMFNLDLNKEELLKNLQ